VNTKTSDNKDFVFLTGSAFLANPLIFPGPADDWHRDNLAIHINPPTWTHIDAVAPVVSLASTFNPTVPPRTTWLSTFGIRHLATYLDHLRNPLTPR
jgi:hypothetical protein